MSDRPTQQSRSLAVRVCDLEFENPFILAASPCTDELEMVARGLAAGWAGAVLKTTSVAGTRVELAYPLMTRLDHAGRRLIGMGNIDLISVHPVEVVAERVRELKRRFPRKVIIASIMGSRREAWEALVRRLEDAGADMIECSFSCPQGSMGEDAGQMLAQSVEATERVAGWVRGAARRIPVSIKITPQVTDIVAVARALERAGVHAISASNSLPALMGVDLETFIPYPSLGDRSTYSGLTGPAIKPVTLRTIAEIARNVPLPILGTGGASDWRDAVEMMLVGAHLVQFCTAPMCHGFGIIEKLKEGLADYLARQRLSSPQALVGRALEHIGSHDELPRHTVRARVVPEVCVGCGRCHIACRDGGHEAIHWPGTGAPRIDAQKCVGCGLCLLVAPKDGCLELDTFDAAGRRQAGQVAVGRRRSEV